MTRECFCAILQWFKHFILDDKQKDFGKMINTSRVIEEKFYEYVEERHFSDGNDPALCQSAPFRQRKVRVIGEGQLDENGMPSMTSVQYMT